MSAARLDRWLVSEQLRHWVSTAHDTLNQTAGYPGDHQGVILSLTAPGGTYRGKAAWRLPLHLLDDEELCTDMAEAITACLREHPTSENLSRGQRWVHLKRHIRLRATARALQTAKARRQALRALEMDSRTAQAQYEANLADAASLLAWKQANHLLQHHTQQPCRPQWSGSNTASSPPSGSTTSPGSDKLRRSSPSFAPPLTYRRQSRLTAPEHTAGSSGPADILQGQHT